MHLCLIIPLDGRRLGMRPVDPGYGVEGGAGIDNALPNPPPGQPGHLPSLPVGWPIPPVDPGYGHPGRPGAGHHPDQGLPHLPGVPDNSLPTTPPPSPPPGMVVVLARTPDGKWHWATIPLGTIPTPLPVPPPVPQPR